MIARAERVAVTFHESDIDSIIERVAERHLPGVAVGIAVRGKPIYRKAFGVASIADGDALSPTTRMRIQSATKHFTCLAYLLLCEEGAASPGDRVGKYMAELHPVAHQVTMLQLMGHTSGLRDVHDIRYQFSGMQKEVPTGELLSLYREIDDTNFAPGASWNYCNGGYSILSTVIERIADRSLEEVMRKRIFEPVGMDHTSLERFDTQRIRDGAINYTTTPSGELVQAYPVGALAGNGGIVSTIDDMLRWLAHMSAPTVGRASTWALMREPLTLRNGTSTKYGLGLVVGRYRGVGTIYHAGGTVGSNSHMLKVPAADLDIEIMLNRDDISAVELAEKVMDTCLGGLSAPGMTSISSVAEGTFRSVHTGRVIQLMARNDRQYASIDAADVALEQDENGWFWPCGASQIERKAIRFVGDAEKPGAIRLDDFGHPDTLTWLPPGDAAEIRELAGSYVSDKTHTRAEVVATEEGASLHTVGRFGSADFRLECVGSGIWRARSTRVSWLGGIVSFSPDGAVFHYSTLRNRALPFRRVS